MQDVNVKLKPGLLRHQQHSARRLSSPGNGLNFNPLNAELNPICHLLALLEAHHIPHFIFFLRFITQTLYTGCTRINYKIVSITNFNKYLNYGTNGNELYVYKYGCK
jgi:hypothetical protein